MSDVLFDDQVLSYATPDTIVKRLKIWFADQSRPKYDFNSLDLNAVRLVPSRMRCKRAFQTSIGKRQLNASIIGANDLLKAQERAAPYALRILYHDVKEHLKRLSSDVPVRLAQTAFELNLLHEMIEKFPSNHMMNIVGEVDHLAFEAVRMNVLNNAFFRLNALLRRNAGNNDVSQEADKRPKESGAFLNELFADVADPYALELLNMLEFGGYNLDDPEIIPHIIKPHELFFQKELFDIGMA